MSKVFILVFVIFGTVVGSGFASGKEIMIYFSRFGVLSYFNIAIAAILFFLLFLFFLRKGSLLTETIEKSKLVNFCAFFISLVFCSSMFAGVRNLFSYFPTWVCVLLVGLLVFLCFLVTLKGKRGLENVNLFLMPATSLVFLIVLIFCAGKSSDVQLQTNPIAGFFYGPLYVALNSCMSGLVICKFGAGLTKKQAFSACLFSTLLLSSFLILGNFVLSKNGDSYFAQMPFLYLCAGNELMFSLAYAVILAGCVTTLVSLCFNIKSSVDKVTSNKFVSTAFSVFVPLVVSLLGFSQIVSYLYPFCSVLGVFILFHLVFSCLKKS